MLDEKKLFLEFLVITKMKKYKKEYFSNYIWLIFRKLSILNFRLYLYNINIKYVYQKLKKIYYQIILKKSSNL